MSVSRRDVLKFAAATPGVLGLGVVASSLRAAPASAGSLGTLLDYAAGVIPASQIRAAGAVGESGTCPIGGLAAPGCLASRSSSARPVT
ncbi:Conserved exported protein of uncharacterised function [Mycobacterium tuberculosis]|nr:Conserved exported protein of uncharacterised function [Mycobacterium tuberculosis]CMS83742.1 Conserved exported protein of uncharacterised function [Mycobacterium tuberculosis]